MLNHAPFVPWMYSLLDRMKELYNKPNARTIAEALPDITGALHYRGTKATVADLPSSGNATGDVWHITADGSEWAWDGFEWQNLGGTDCAEKPNVVAVSGAAAAISAADNTIYECGELTSLTVSSFPATGKFWIWFTSGSTPTTTTGISNFAAEVNKRYRITVENGYATYDSWATS